MASEKKLSEKKLASNQRYMAQLEDIKLRVPSGYRKVLKDYAETQYGMSVNALIIKLVNEDMQRNGKANIIPSGMSAVKVETMTVEKLDDVSSTVI